MDTERHRVFASYGADGVVEVLDLGGGGVMTVTTGHRAEHLYFDPIRDEVVVSLPVANHSAYWWDDEQEGYVAAVDAETLADPSPIWIPMDPFQIAADGLGHAIISGGSGQWTSVASVDLTSESYQAAYGVYDQSRLRIHPSRDRVYLADVGLSPSDIERFDLSDAGVVSASYDSPYHGDYPMCGDLRLHPTGNTIWTRCGHVFLASNSKPTDMTWLADVGVNWRDLDFEPSGQYALLLTAEAGTLRVMDVETLDSVEPEDIAPADRVLVGTDYFVLVRQALHGAIPYTDVEVLHLSE